jgi:hypothetical protein
VTTISEMSIASISIGERVRKDMGDIAALSASISKHGLLHPPAVTSDGLLIAGHRRILACTSLGMDTIPVRIIDVGDLLSAERDENEVRKAFTPSEAVAIARVIEDELKERANANKSEGAKARWAKEKGQAMLVGESPTSIKNLSRSSASSAVGMCDQRYRRAKEVVEAAEQDAKAFGDIVETMDATNNVNGAYTELRRRRDKAPARHAVLKKMAHRDPNKEIQRAITSLDGLVIGIERIDITNLDPALVAGWIAELKGHASSINRFIRSIHHEFSHQA